MRAGISLKRIIKRALKRAIRAGALMAPGSAAGARILTYHSVGERDHEMNVRPEEFRRQMEWLAAHHRVIPLSQAAEGVPGVAITFDDGYVDNLRNAAPVLTGLNVPATVFVAAGRMGGMLEHDTDPATSTLMTWREARELTAMGIAIGGHSMTHRRLSSLCAEEQRQEILGCMERIREELGHAPEGFAYPFGTASDYNATALNLVQEAGFRYAVSNRYGVNRPPAERWELRRIWIDITDDFETFKAKVDGRLDVLALLDSAAGVRARRLLNRALRA